MARSCIFCRLMRVIKYVERFDVEALAGPLQWMGAKYLVFTLGQNSGRFDAPNSVYDRITGYAKGDHCAERDVRENSIRPHS